MKNNNKDTTIRISKSLKLEFEKLKKYRTETYEDLIKRILEEKKYNKELKQKENKMWEND